MKSIHFSKLFIAIDFYNGPMSGVADAPRSFAAIDLPGRTGWHGERLTAAVDQIDSLEVGQAIRLVVPHYKYEFILHRTE